MPIDPTQNSDTTEDFMAMADGDDTEGHLGAAAEADSSPDGFRAAVDGDDAEGEKDGFRQEF